jgi:hypothetical protein
VHEGVNPFQRDQLGLKDSDDISEIDDVAAQVDGVVHQQAGQRGTRVAAQQTVTD